MPELLTVQKIAENVVPDEVFAVSASGEPAAVFYMTELSNSTVRMSDLDSQLGSSSVESVVETAVSAVKACIKKTGYLYADTHSTQPVKLDAYNGKKAEFIISGDKLLSNRLMIQTTISRYSGTRSQTALYLRLKCLIRV